ATSIARGGTQHAAEGRERAATMAERVLGLGRQLAERATARGIDEDRIVAEAAAAVRRASDPSFAAPVRFDERPVGPGERERAAKCRPACVVGDVAELLQQQRDVFRVGRVLTGVARRAYARPAAERVDLEAGIVAEDRQPRPPREVARLDARVLG